MLHLILSKNIMRNPSVYNNDQMKWFKLIHHMSFSMSHVLLPFFGFLYSKWYKMSSGFNIQILIISQPNEIPMICRRNHKWTHNFIITFIWSILKYIYYNATVWQWYMNWIVKYYDPEFMYQFKLYTAPLQAFY